MLQNICVIGGGTMGHSIALTFAMHGFPVSLYEAVDTVRAGVLPRVEASLRQLAAAGVIGAGRVGESLARITLHSGMAAAVDGADYVIEAVPEELSIKQVLFAELDALCGADVILASNTSSLRLGDIIEGLPDARRAKCLICHWYNPAHLVPLAELSDFGNMSAEDFEAVRALYVAAGKRPVRVRRDVPGLVANRLLHAMAREALHLLEDGVADAENLDAALRWGPGFRGAAAGLLEQADLGGLDIWCAAEDNFLPYLDDSRQANPLLRGRVAEGRLGVKTGAGFYDWPDQAAAVESFNARLLAQYRLSREQK